MTAKYKVLIVIKDRWWSDGEEFKTFAAAVRHRTKVAQRWSTSETAIGRGSEVLAWKESIEFEAMMKRERAEDEKGKAVQGRPVHADRVLHGRR